MYATILAILLAVSPLMPPPSSVPVFAYGHCWTHTGKEKTCETARWITAEYPDLTEAQRQKFIRWMCGGGIACAPRLSDICVVYSIVSENVAHNMDVWGITLYQHEELHWRYGWTHPIINGIPDWSCIK